jgi:DNA-binding HxlR family transcriptional regulator
VKEILKDLDKAFENKVLASHVKSLEKSEYVTIRKEFLDRKPNTKYYATTLGTEAFKKHINAIERLLK